MKPNPFTALNHFTVPVATSALSFRNKGKSDDGITGNGNTRLIYTNATSGVTVTFGLNSWTSTSSGGSGSVTGDASVGTDSFSGVSNPELLNEDDRRLMPCTV